MGCVVLLTSGAVFAQQGVLGTWREPGGARIEVHRCGADVCARLIQLSANPANTVDAKNPDPALQHRELVGLEIGQGFHLDDASHAEGGRLYDPKSGKTYNGSMVSEGDSMKLRGYVGLKMFGRTEVWTRDSGK
jgi:uncharacterized protein (DUF2147 family)